MENRVGKKLKENWKDYYFIYLAIFVIVFIFFSIIWPVTYAVYDQMVEYILVKTGHYWSSMTASAKGQGRYNFLITQFFSCIPYLFNSTLYYKFLSYACILFDVSALYILVKRYVNKNTALLAVVLFFGFAQIDNQHNLFVAYTGIHQIAIGLALFSIYFFLRYYDEKKKSKYLIFSALLLTVSMIIYESFLTFPLLFLILYGIREKQIKIKKMLTVFRYHIAFVGLHLVIFFVWRMRFPSRYDGSVVEVTSLLDSVKTVVLFALGLFPGFASYRTFLGSVGILKIDAVSFIKAFFVSITVILLVSRMESIKKKGGIEHTCVNFLLVGLAVFLPTLLHGFTPKYVAWMKAGTTGYVPSFYSYFFICLLLSMLLGVLYQSLKYKKAVLFFVFVLAFVTSILTDAGNRVWAEKFYEQRLQKEAFEYVVSRDFFKELPESVIYVPDYANVFGDTERMGMLAEKYTGKKHKFLTQWNSIDFRSPVYILKYEKGTNTMMTAHIDQNYMTNKIIISSPESKECSMIVSSFESTSEYCVNNVKLAVFPQTAVFPITIQGGQEIVVEGTTLDFSKTSLVNETLTKIQAIECDLGSGFYGYEAWGSWCESQGILRIVNKTGLKQKVKFSAVFKAGEEANLFIKGCGREENLKIKPTPEKVELELDLEIGANQIEILCDANLIVTNNGDTRNLIFGISDIDISSILPIGEKNEEN